MTYQSEVLADSPVLYWRLGEASGSTAQDATANNNDGTYVNGPTLGTPGLVGDADTAVTFVRASNTQVVSTGTFGPTTYGALTLEAVVEPSALTGYQHICGILSGTADIELVMRGDATPKHFGAIVAGATSSWGVGFGTVVPVVGTAYHLAATFDGTTLRLYIDGVEVDTDTDPTEPASLGAAENFTVGDDSFGGDGFDGIIDEFAFYTTALSGARVADHRAAGFGPATINGTVAVNGGGSIAVAGSRFGVRLGIVAVNGGGTIAVGGSSPLSVLPLLNGTAGATTFSVVVAEPTLPLPTPAGQGTLWQVLAVDRFGVVYAEYPTAKVKPIVWVKNMPETGGALIPIDAPDLDELPLADDVTTPHREMQIWRNGHLLLWCVPTGQQANSTDRVYDYSCKGLLWYLSRRYMGQANRHNVLTDGTFETAGLPDWPVEGAGITQSQDVVHRVLGPNSMRLDQTTGGLDAFAHQANLITSTPIGLALFLTVWVWVQTFTAPAYGNRGVYIERSGTGIFVNYEIVATTPTQALLRASKTIHMPPSVSEIIDVRIYPPEGTLYADAATLTVEESLSMIAVNSPTGDGWDQIDMARYVLDYAQGRGAIANAWPEGNGKSDLNFGFAGVASSVLKERTWQFMDHQRIYIGPSGNGVLDEFLKADDGFDISIETTPTTRTFTTHYPRIGVDRTDLELRYVKRPDNPALDSKWGIVKWTFAKNIEQAANDIVILGGWGTGAGREEGGYSDPDTLGGLTLELVESAPQGTPIDALNSFAAARGAQLSTAVQTPNLILAEPRDLITNEVNYPLIGVLMPGDRVPIHVDDGNVQMDGTYEIVRVELDPETDFLHVTVNPVAA